MHCLLPPLHAIPPGEWFCSSCASYDSDTSSVVNIDSVDNFVVEQCKRATAEKGVDDFVTCLSISSNSNIEGGTSDFFDYPDALSISGYVNRRDMKGVSIRGVHRRKFDGALPCFAYPAVKCSKCHGHFPTNVLSQMFALPLSLPERRSKLFKGLKCDDNKNPPLPWGICTGFSYVCGQCCTEGSKYGIDGNLCYNKYWSLPWKDAIMISLLNLILLANPTLCSKKKMPFGFPKYSTKFRKFLIYFETGEIIRFLDFHWVYFSRFEKESSNWRSNIDKSLAEMVNDGIIEKREGENSLYTPTEKGFKPLVSKYL